MSSRARCSAPPLQRAMLRSTRDDIKLWLDLKASLSAKLLRAEHVDRFRATRCAATEEIGSGKRVFGEEAGERRLGGFGAMRCVRHGGHLEPHPADGDRGGEIEIGGGA